MVDPVVPLKGARIWLSGSIPPEADAKAMTDFIEGLADKIFKAGGSIIHGSHETIWPTLVKRAAEFQKSGAARTCLTLAVSQFFNDQPDYRVRLEEWRKHAIVYEVPRAGQGDDARSQSLTRMRRAMADRCDAVVVVGGKWWQENPGRAGVPEELELARERGLPCFLIAGLGGAVADYLKARPEILRGLKNGLDEEQNRKLATETSVDRGVDQVVGQLRLLPLVRGEPTGGATFRILALDGGGIKGTFTAAVLARWEELTKLKLCDHFDMIAGTSTGGILALGIGMGLKADDILKFYVDRGPTVFPVTSLLGRWGRGFCALFRPSYVQDVLRAELESAFAGTPNTLRQSLCRLVIPACHARSGAVHLFRTNHHPDLVADADLSATDVAVATAAAPTYFRAAEINGVSYVDGGVWANNPALAALVDAVAKLHVPANHIDILSVGTTSQVYSGDETLRAGLGGWAFKTRIINLLMHAQAQGIAELAGSLAGRGRARLLRIDEALVRGAVSLDDVKGIPKLRDHGREVAAREDVMSQVRERFLNGVPVEKWTAYGP